MFGNYRVIDLTHTLSNDMLTYRAMPPFKIEPWRKAEEVGFNALQLSLATHHGTHMDAPSHFITGARVTMTDLPADRFVGTGIVLHIPRDRDEGIAAADLEAAERRQGHQVQPGDMVFLHTGFQEKYSRDADAYGYHYPFLYGDAAEWLVARRAKIVGMDSTSFDQDGGVIPDTTPAHNALLGAGIPLIEELVNLDQIADRAFFVALPLPIWRADGSPCRVVALV